MKKYIILLLLPVFLSCESEESIKRNIEKLRQERVELEKIKNNLESSNNDAKLKLNELLEKIKPLEIKAQGLKPNYILTLKLKQFHYTLDIGKHIKDEINVIEFQIPVDEDFYNHVSVGTNIVDRFRFGSLIMKGSFGTWQMTVQHKEIH